ncbi:MAG TPA: LysR family transcriptional regulator [Solirubrobacteraceae bacterium]|jgi:DNA-binding transcriptional LysR family regulator
MPFRLEQLRYFVAVAEEGQFTRAARDLHVAQPALSQAIANLESELGVELLTRHARGVTPTPAGETFLAKARVALAATMEAAMTARSLARAATGTLEFGFLGLPPMVDAPDLFAAFAEAEPDAALSFRSLPYPRGSLASWLANVDVALCHSPTSDPEVNVLPLWAEQRFVLAATGHHLAGRGELEVRDVLGETYLGSHPAVDPQWAGFWRLDDHRGGPPSSVTSDRALSLAATVAMVACGRAITSVPASQAAAVAKLLSGVVAIPLRDARPTVLSLLWRRDVHNALVGSLATVAKRLTVGGRGGEAAEVPDRRQLRAVSAQRA